MFFLRCFCPVWVLVRVFQKMQKISTLGRLSVLMIKIRKSVEKDWKSFDFQSKLFGGDKRDRTADLMTARCYRFVISSVFSSNPSVVSAKSAGFHKILSIASTRIRAHLGHNLGQDKQVNLEKSLLLFYRFFVPFLLCYF